MKRLLYDLQLSFINKATGKFMVEQDSNFNFCRGIEKNLNKNFQDTSMYVLTPARYQAEEFTHLEFASEIPIEYNADVFASRFTDFADMKQLKDTIDWIKPDVIWTNDMTRVPAYKLFTDAKIIAYNHWIDNRIMPKISEDKTYVFRQAEGAWKSDLPLLNSQFGCNFFISGLYDFIEGGEIIPQIRSKLYAIPPLVDIANAVKSPKFERPTIMFNHRMSSLPYYKKNFDAFVTACEYLKKFCDFDVILTNPSGYALSELPKYMKVVTTNSYAEYLKVLSKCWLCVAAFFESYGTWSMSVTDAILANTVVMLPNKFGYPEMVKPGYEYLCDNDAALQSKLRIFITYFDIAGAEKTAEENLKFAAENYSTKTKFEKLQAFLD